ncbi:MAG: hypothetical protein ACK55Z_28585 [bacterium]
MLAVPRGLIQRPVPLWGRTGGVAAGLAGAHRPCRRLSPPLWRRRQHSPAEIPLGVMLLRYGIFLFIV